MTTRRTFLFQVVPAAVAVAALGQRANAAALKELSVDNSPAAKALKYVTKSTTAGQTCDNCKQFVASNKTCKLFAGYTVQPKGWCKSWVKI